jgi:hypothetical protein
MFHFLRRRDYGEGGVTSFTDDFNRGDSASLGSDWTEVDGDWEIASNKLQANTGSSDACFALCNTELDTDHYAQVEFHGETGTAIYLAAVVVRANETTGYMASYAENAGTVAYRNRWSIHRKTANISTTNLVTEAATSTKPANGSVIRLNVEGDQIWLVVNGEVILRATNSAYTGTKAGLVAQVSTAAPQTVTYDNFEFSNYTNKTTIDKGAVALLNKGAIG